MPTKKKRKKGVMVTMELERETVKALDLVAAAEERSRSFLIRKLLAAGAQAELERVQAQGSDLERYCSGLG